MIRIPVLHGVVALALFVGSAAAQEAGGLSAVGGGQSAAAPGMMAPPGPVAFGQPPSRTPVSVAEINPARGRQQAHQVMVARARGDAGFLGGFFRGQPLAPSRQPPPEFVVPNFTFIDAPFIVNNFSSNVTIGLDDPDAASEAPDAEEAEGEPADETESRSPSIPPFLSGGISFNNLNSTVNAAIGSGNVAVQQIATDR